MIGESNYAFGSKNTFDTGRLVWNYVRYGILACLLGAAFIGCEAIPAVSGYSSEKKIFIGEKL